MIVHKVSCLIITFFLLYISGIGVEATWEKVLMKECYHCEDHMHRINDFIWSNKKKLKKRLKHVIYIPLGQASPTNLTCHRWILSKQDMSTWIFKQWINNWIGSLAELKVNNTTVRSLQCWILHVVDLTYSVVPSLWHTRNVLYARKLRR